MPNLSESIRLLAVQAVESTKPTMRLFGVVTSVEPLKIQINEKMVLSGRQLTVTQTIRNYINWGFLEIDDKVILTRQAGGQVFIVDDMLETDKNIDDYINKGEDNAS